MRKEKEERQIEEREKVSPMGNECQSCPYGVSIEAYTEYQKRMEDEKERVSHRLKKLEEKVEHIASLTSSVEKLAISVESMAKNLDEQNDRLKVIEGKDGEMWRKVLTQTVVCIIGGLVGYVLAKIGLG